MNEKKQYLQILELISLIRQEQDLIATCVKELTDLVGSLVKQLRIDAQQNQHMFKKVDSLLLKGSSQIPHNRVYALTYFNQFNGKMVTYLILSETFEEAVETCKSTMMTDEVFPDMFTLDNWQSIDVPNGNTQETTKKVERELPMEHPIDAFINELTLVKDRFAVKGEKDTIDRIMKRIEKQYGKQ